MQRLRYFALANLRTRARSQHTNTHIQQTYIWASKSKNKRAMVCTLDWKLQLDPLDPCSGWAHGVWVAITQSVTHGDCHGTGVSSCKAPVQAHSLSHLLESGGGKDEKLIYEETSRSCLVWVKSHCLIIINSKALGQWPNVHSLETWEYIYIFFF